MQDGEETRFSRRLHFSSRGSLSCIDCDRVQSLLLVFSELPAFVFKSLVPLIRVFLLICKILQVIAAETTTVKNH